MIKALSNPFHKNRPVGKVLVFGLIVLLSCCCLSLLQNHKAFAETLTPSPQIFSPPFIKANFENPNYPWPDPAPADLSCGSTYYSDSNIVVSQGNLVASPDTISPPWGATTANITYISQQYICIIGGGEWPTDPIPNPAETYTIMGNSPLSPGGGTISTGLTEHGYYTDLGSQTYTVPLSALTPGCQIYQVPWTMTDSEASGLPEDSPVSICYNPAKQPDKPPSGFLTLACQLDGSTLVTPSWNDGDGPDPDAYFTVINPDGTNQGNYSLTNNVPSTLTSKADPGAALYMYAADILPDGTTKGYDLIWQGLAPLCPKQAPVYTSATAVCGPPATLTFSVNDPKDTTDPITNVFVVGPDGVKYYPTLSGSTYSLDISNFSGWASQTFTVSATDNGGTSTTTVTLPPCAHSSISCSLGGGDTFDTNTPFSIDPTVLYTTGSEGVLPTPATYPMGISISFIPSYNNPNVPYTSTSTTVVANPTLSFGAQPAGVYTVNITLGTASCSQTIDIANEPYISLRGGDAVAGSSFYTNDTCDNSGNGGSNIESFNQGSSGSYAGAGSQFAAFVLGDISGFATAQNTNTGNSLSFAHSGSDSGGHIGSLPCANDYYAFYSKVSGANIDTSSTLTLNGLSVTDGHPIIDVVKDQDVVINNNIAYISGANQLINLPDFKLIVEGGNIYINNNVTQLDGLYVAEPDSGGGGDIYDCASGTTPEAANNTNYDSDCGNQLIINGSLVAKDVQFMRTNGSIGNAASDNGAAGTCTESGSCSGSDAAEIINFNPLVWMTSPGSTQSPSSYDSIVSLPPVL